MEEERFDIYDEALQWIGTATRSETHRAGHWHRTFHCWVVARAARRVEVLVQRRHRDKDTNPGLFDISCAGHLAAGEGPEDGVRELLEELGVEVAFAALRPIGSFRQEYRGDGIIDREISDVYLYDGVGDLDAYTPQADEIEALYFADASDLLALFDGQADIVVLRGHGEEVRVTRGDFVAHGDAYYRAVFRACLSKGDGTVGEVN